MGSVSAEVARDRDQKAWVLRTQRFMTVYQIAAELGVDVSTVSRSLKRQGERITKELAATLEAQKAEQTMQIDMVVGAAWEGWQRSQEDAVEQSERQKSVAAQPDTGKPKKRDGGTGELFGDDDDFDPEDVPGGCYMDADGNELDPEETARRIAEHAFQKGKSDKPPVTGSTIVESIKAEKRKGQVGDARFLQVAMSGLEAKRKIWGLDAPKPEGSAPAMVVKVYKGEDVRDLVRGTVTVTATAVEPSTIAATSVEFTEEAGDDDY